jgi:hypothetical protein
VRCHLSGGKRDTICVKHPPNSVKQHSRWCKLDELVVFVDFVVRMSCHVLLSASRKWKDVNSSARAEIAYTNRGLFVAPHIIASTSRRPLSVSPSSSGRTEDFADEERFEIVQMARQKRTKKGVAVLRPFSLSRPNCISEIIQRTSTSDSTSSFARSLLLWSKHEASPTQSQRCMWHA